MKHYIKNTTLLLLVLFCSFLFSLSSANRKLNIILDSEPSFESPVSQLATENQFYSPSFLFWCSELQEPFHMHRKLWEYCYVSQVLHHLEMLKPGKKGLGFGVGTEPLPALFAKYGVQVLASDQDFNNAKTQGWVVTNQYAMEKSKLNNRNICEPNQFNALVELRPIDMNAIDINLQDFDFVWSCCSLEHLGSLEAGINFFKNSMKCLKPGGIAVHTTEFNLSSTIDTIEFGPTVIYRRQDILNLAMELIKMGYNVMEINFHPGNGPVDRYVDLPPYLQDPHIKLRINSYDCTSIGIVAQKPNK